jgi:hypothetical protein
MCLILFVKEKKKKKEKEKGSPPPVLVDSMWTPHRPHRLNEFIEKKIESKKSTVSVWTPWRPT